MRKVLARVEASISFRSGPPLARIVAALPPRRGPTRPAASFSLLAMCGRRHIVLLRESLTSLLHAWERHPRLVVVSDGTLEPSKIRAEVTRWWPYPSPEIWAPTEVVQAAERSGIPGLAAYAAATPFGLKLASILRSAERRPTLFADADILWFRDFSREVEGLAAGTAPVHLHMCHDAQRSYDDRALAAMGLRLDDPPFVNCGVVFARGDIAGRAKLGSLVETVAGIYAAPGAPPDVFAAEQTLWALAGRRLGAGLWPLSTIALLGDDARSLRVTFRRQDWTARHYTSGVRHLFWRDALALRAGVRPDARPHA